MAQPKSFFEIELKALLSEEKYKKLTDELPKKMKKINEEIIFTTRYRPGDIRLRHSDKTIEIVCKEGDPTKISRKEIVLPLPTKEYLEHFAQALEMLDFTFDPPWEKHKQEFMHKHKGYEYVVCVQHIKNFAYILEVEFLSENDDAHIHEPNLREIIESLGCEPINPEDFSKKIKAYIKKNNKK